MTPCTGGEHPPVVGLHGASGPRAGRGHQQPQAARHIRHVYDFRRTVVVSFGKGGQGDSFFRYIIFFVRDLFLGP
jgi:hypothetical protein